MYEGMFTFSCRNNRMDFNNTLQGGRNTHHQRVSSDIYKKLFDATRNLLLFFPAN